jgi:hypothetical protein
MQLNWKDIAKGELMHSTRRKEIRLVATDQGHLWVETSHYDDTMAEEMGGNPVCEVTRAGQHDGHPLYALKRMGEGAE